MITAHTRRAIVIVLLILTAVVCIRAASAARGEPRDPLGASRGTPAGHPGMPATLPGAVSLRIAERASLLTAPDRIDRTLEVTRGGPGARAALDLDWEARVGDTALIRGSERLSGASLSGTARVRLSLPLPAIDGPAGVDLAVRVREAGTIVGEATFPFVAYPAEGGRLIQDRLERARVALYDPTGGAARPLRLLGLSYQEIATPHDLTLFEGDLIVIGPGGFTREHEALGPILGARARSGMRVLLLDQPTLPATFSEELRLWPSFSPNPEATVLLTAGHPVTLGLSADHDRDFFATAVRTRPFLPPARGNFRVLAEVRVPSGGTWQEGVSILEMPIGQGTLLASQADLCASFDRDPQSRILLTNSLAYLLGDRPRPRRASLYGTGPESLPLCLRHLSPYAPLAGPDLEGMDLLLVPGDWQALRERTAEGMAPLARAARFLHDGGTMLLLNPQSLVLDYLSRLTGGTAYFESPGDGPASSGGSSAAMLDGISPEDLALLARGARSEFRLRPRRGPDGVELLLIAPGMARYRVGRGTLVALTLPQASECSAAPVSSLLARLLTNLGVPLDPDPGIDPEAITRLNEQTGD